MIKIPSKKYQIPKNLEPYIGSNFDRLIPSEDSQPIENQRIELAEVLENLSKVVNGKPIYRAIQVKNLKESEEELIESGHYGNSWSAEIGGADTSYNYGSQSKGYFDENQEPDPNWEEKSGSIIMEGIVSDPKAIDFNQTIDLYFQFGDEENEINIGNDWGFKLTQICKGSTTGRARKQFTEKKCRKL